MSPVGENCKTDVIWFFCGLPKAVIEHGEIHKTVQIRFEAGFISSIIAIFFSHYRERDSLAVRRNPSQDI